MLHKICMTILLLPVTITLPAQGVDEIFDRINRAYTGVNHVEYASVVEVYDLQGQVLQKDSSALKMFPPYYYMYTGDMRIIYNKDHYVLVDDYHHQITLLDVKQLATRDKALDFTRGLNTFKEALDTFYVIEPGKGEALAYKFELKDALYSAAEVYLDEQWKIKRIRAYYRDREQLCCYEQRYVIWSEVPVNDLDERMRSVVVSTEQGLVAGSTCRGYTILNSLQASE